jgi:hypothetical protein
MSVLSFFLLRFTFQILGGVGWVSSLTSGLTITLIYYISGRVTFISLFLLFKFVIEFEFDEAHGEAEF